MLQFPSFRVGGCVRDEIMGLPVKDIDFAVEAPSFAAMHEAIVARVQRVFLVSPEHLTVRALDPEFGPVDFVLCRADGPSSDGRHPDFVRPGTIIEDLARRDFTVNAIAVAPDGRVIDPHKGRRDITRNVLQFVGDPRQRLAEDALRAFRALRFAITKGFRITLGTHKALQTMKLDDFDAVSTERIRDELVPCFAKDTGRALELLTAHRVMLDLTLERGIWLKPTMEQP